MTLKDHALKKLAVIAQTDPEKSLSNSEVRTLLGLTAPQWQRMRTAPGFPDPFLWGHRLMHSPAKLVPYFTKLHAKRAARSLRQFAAELHLSPVTLARWSRLPGFPVSVEEVRGVPVFDPAAVRHWVRDYRGGMKLPDDFNRARKPRKARRK